MMLHAQRLGHALVEQGVISEDQLRIALRERPRSKQMLGRILVRLGFLSEDALRDALSADAGQASIDLSTAPPCEQAIALIPESIARRHLLFPLSLDCDPLHLTLAMADPDDLIALDRVRALLGNTHQLTARIAGESDILAAIDRHYGAALSVDGVLRDSGANIPRAAQDMSDYTGQPAVKLVDALLAEAVRRGASDIHFEPEDGFLRIRYRVDGVLHHARSLHNSYWPSMAVRLKVLSGMDIAETRSPQDGHFSSQIAGRRLDFRSATHPTAHGENMVLRILDRHKGIVPIARLGFDDSTQAALMRLIAKPEGILLVTGPTGSGKTTTLYSILGHLNTEMVNIMTLEDPVEYPVAMMRQTTVGEAAKLDFSGGIRSIMRQDPDIILVGEIRDRPAAEMAFRAAMTGHRVYSTLHANSAAGAIPRLLDIGIPPDIIAGNLIGVIAQRLVRVLCPHCKRADDDTAHRANGCEHCRLTGYQGRIALMELLVMDAELDELIARRASVRELRRAAAKKGFRTLAQDGMRCVREGITTMEEVMRVVDVEEHPHPASLPQAGEGTAPKETACPATTTNP
ncbi:MAG: GspE/PulE family protein [Gallionellaceae bacterium]|jgi:type II secretory ATPase GspE/PulE/Tfp pilus assembly ATPase PilB-like protein|nr:GspE/PulE family protein [Gallionellaceae bacterium]